MKKIFLLLLFFCFYSFVYSNTFTITAGYEPVFMNFETENELITGRLRSNGATVKALYLFNEKFGVNFSVSTTLYPAISIKEYIIENNNKQINKKIDYKDFSNSLTSIQIGTSFIGDCDFCYFKPQISFDTSILKINNQIAIYNGLSFDYSYNQYIKKSLLSVGCNVCCDFISYSSIQFTDFNTIISKITYRIAPYITFGISF